MCGPMIGMIGSVISGISGMMQAQAAAQAAEMQQKAMEDRARQEREAGAMAQQKAMRNAARVGGQQRAAFAEGGLGVDGSAFDVSMDTANEADMDILMIGHNARAAQSQSLAQAAIHKANAQSARAAAPFAFLSPILAGAARFPTAFGLEA